MLSLGVYILGFMLLAPFLHDMAVDLAMLPIGAAGLLAGMPAALAVAALLIPVHTILLNAQGLSGWDAIAQAGHVPLQVAAFGLAVVVGKVRELSDRNHQQAVSLRQEREALNEALGERIRAEQELRAQTELYQALIRAQSDLGEAIVIAERGRPTFWNPAFLDLTGRSAAEIGTLGSLLDLVSVDDRDAVRGRIRTHRRGGGQGTLEVALTRSDGRRVELEFSLTPLSARSRGAVVLVARDITQRKEDQRELERRALHDELTGLPNRTLIEDRLEQALLVGAREDRPASLLMIDLDRFKEVNDTFGHAVGDELLRQVAVLLRQHVRAGDTVARLGGDEFAVVLPGADEDGAARVAAQLLEALQRPIHADGHDLRVGASIGIASAPQQGRDATELFRCADVAMYEAKRAGGGQRTYSPERDGNSAERLALGYEFRRALEQDELDLYFQPQVRVSDGALVGVEVLTRWPRADRGEVLPDTFLPLADQLGLTSALTAHVLRSLRTALPRINAVAPGCRVAVNVTVRDLFGDRLLPDLAELCRQRERVPLTIELTEHGVIADPERVARSLESIRQMGIAISVDDFGTGNSPLAYLKHLPIDELKIDKSFVTQMTRDSDSAAIVRATIGLAHELGIAVVAEGVEDRATHDALATIGCDVAQGYYHARPMPLEAFERWASAVGGERVVKRLMVTIPDAAPEFALAV